MLKRLISINNLCIYESDLDYKVFVSEYSYVSCANIESAILFALNYKGV